MSLDPGHVLMALQGFLGNAWCARCGVYRTCWIQMGRPVSCTVCAARDRERTTNYNEGTPDADA